MISTMKKRNALLATVTAVTMGALLAGCGMTATTTKDGQVGFPDPAWAWMKEGTFVNVDNLRKVQPGLTKDQVYALIAEPHFQEGMLFVHVWNYIFDFRREDNTVVQCQYQVQYDSHMRVKATYWKDPGCARFLERPQPPAPAPQPVAQHFTLQAGALFLFNRSGAADILPQGRIELDRLAGYLQSHYRTINSVTITGYTDRIGSDSYNRRLLQARAEAVRDYLVAHGVRADSMPTIGMGKANPVTTNCPAGHSAAVIQCLAPDRRVTVDVNGQTEVSGQGAAPPAGSAR